MEHHGGQLSTVMPLLRQAGRSPSATMTTIDDTAVVFEGGGMRNAYTAAVVSELIAEGINFPHVSGVSTGASHLCNFVSRDAARAHVTFVDLVDDPEFGGVSHFRRGQGYFNAEYIYERICYPDGAMPFDLGAFLRNPARTNVAVFNVSRGRCGGSPRKRSPPWTPWAR